MLLVTDTLVDNYEKKDQDKARADAQRIGVVLREKKDKDGIVIGFALDIPFKKWTVAKDTLLADLEEAAEKIGAEKFAKIVNSGLDLYARQQKRAELKESEPGKKAARAAAQLWINERAFEHGDLSYLKDYSAALKESPTAANEYLDSLIASDEYKAMGGK